MASFDLIGSSSAFRTLPDNDEMIGSVDSAVRMERKAGTSKGVIARGNYEVDARHKNCLIEPDCETIPNSLGRELFGCEYENTYLHSELRREHNFDEIIGNSYSLRRVLEQVETVAPTDSIVMIQGETGTGKELIARAIHKHSTRKASTFVKLNCAAIPLGLLESELFGHEKGAFTGAIAQKVGRFELANRGTLFLDEVGDIPLELQPKLLRVLQEQEFERLGGTRSIRVNVRLISATNCDLAEMMTKRQFRTDLYYRLNVFPLRLPSLRERSDDIPVLVRHFTQKYARKMGKRITSIPVEAIDRLSEWHWPGNIRELENFIERAVIITRDTELEVPLAELDNSLSASSKKGYEDEERDRIVRALRASKGRLAGPGGAAERLSIKRTTLIARMNKLGIDAKRLRQVCQQISHRHS